MDSKELIVLTNTMTTMNPYAKHEQFKDRIHTPINLRWEDFGDPTIWRPALKDETRDVYNEFWVKVAARWINGATSDDEAFSDSAFTHRIRLSDRPWPEVPAEHPASPWIACADRMPTKEDASEAGYVIYRHANELIGAGPWHTYVSDPSRVKGSYWMPIPPLPKAPEVDPIPVGYHAATEPEMLALPKGYLVWCDTSVARTWVAGANPGEDVRYSGLSFACPDAPVEAAEEWVQLEASDVPPGSVFRRASWSDGDWVSVERLQASRIWFNGVTLESYTFKQLLQDGWQILRPGSTWMPCKKLKRKEPA